MTNLRTTLIGMLAVSVAAVSSPASAQTITFDDLSCNAETVSDGYQGLDWNLTDCSNGSLTPFSGYNTLDGPGNVAFGPFETPFGFSSTTTFNFIQVDVAPAWNNNLSLQLQGFLGGSLVYNENFVLTGPHMAQQLLLNWANIDEVLFSPSGGVKHPDVAENANGTHLAIDNIVLGPLNVVPEPGTYAMLAVGLAGLWAIRRRRAA